MNINGEASFNVPMEKVWVALHDPEVLIKVIPGCEGLKLKESGEYEVKLKLGVAAVKGEYKGKVRLTDVEVPSHYIFSAEGNGSPGHVTAKMDCKLISTDNGCKLLWNCDAEIGGMIASVGSRVMGGIAKFMAGKFFKDIEKQI